MKRLLIPCVLALVLILLFLWLAPGWLEPLAETRISRLGSEYLGVEVTVEDVRISLFRREIEVSGLTVANPPGFSPIPFAEVGDLRVRTGVFSFLSSQGRIYEITARPVRLFIERQGMGFNYQVILEHLKGRKRIRSAALGLSGASSVRVDRILLDDVSARVKWMASREPLDLEIGQVEIHDLDTSDGSAALLQVLEQLLKPALR